jgi:NAD(P)-dependent dehydrogenase (short-subunit alcohol dehydrogenase family)
MSKLESFRKDSTAVVIGASGSIGGAFVSALAKENRIKTLFALSRSPVGHESPIRDGRIDILDESSVSRAAAEIATEAPIDLIIVATGILHEGESLRPEKSLRELDGSKLEQVFRINTVGPMLVAKHFLPLMRRDHKTVFAVLSARVGSIGDNRLGGWYAYRVSKAAINMGIKGLAIEHSRRAPHSVLVSLHPGTVASKLSEPYTGGSPAARVFQPDYSADRLLDVVDTLCEADSGGFFAWDGESIEY